MEGASTEIGGRRRQLVGEECEGGGEAGDGGEDEDDGDEGGEKEGVEPFLDRH